MGVVFLHGLDVDFTCKRASVRVILGLVKMATLEDSWTLVERKLEVDAGFWGWQRKEVTLK